MTSLYDELSGRIEVHSGRSVRDRARTDLGMLLFGSRDALRELWAAADSLSARTGESEAHADRRLASAVAALRPLFGERAAPRNGGGSAS